MRWENVTIPEKIATEKGKEMTKNEKGKKQSV